MTSPAEATPGGRAAGPRLPKYYAVKTELLALTGSLSAGSPVPGERELARRYGTSRTTIRQALAELAVEGRLVRVHGRGTFVAEPKLAQPLELATVAGPLRAHGHRLATQLLDTGYRAADLELALLLAIRPGGRVLRISRLRFADGKPMAIDRSYLPARRFPGLRRKLHRDAGLYQTLATDYGVELAEAEETIETVLASPADARLLAADPGLPLLLLSRRALDPAGTPVEWSQSWYRGDRYKFVTRTRRPPGPGQP